MDHHEILNNASSIVSILTEASDIIKKIYWSQDFNTELKSDQSPVTTADIKSHEYIMHELALLYPEIPIVSEESELPPYDVRKKWEYFWLLDPLDGTKEFLKRTGEFTINLALIQGTKSIAGFINIPLQEKTYFAIKDLGAFCYQSDGDHTPLQVNTFDLNKKGIQVVASRNHKDKKTQVYIDALNEPEIIEKGSALKFISIASGEADYYPRMINIMEWDTAAGQIIIEEAGGSFVNAETGMPLSYNKAEMYNPYFIAAGKIIKS